MKSIPASGDWALVVNSLQNYLRARSLAVPPSAQLERRAHRDFVGGAKQQRVTGRRALLDDLAVSNARFQRIGKVLENNRNWPLSVLTHHHPCQDA